MSSILLDENAIAPSTPAGGKSIIYPKSDGLWYSKDDAGTETPFSIPLPLTVANGGTGAVTLTGVLKGNGTGAVTAITIPADATKYLDGTGVFSVPATGTPGGSNTQVQFNDSSAFGGDAGLTYNKISDALTIAGQLIISGASAGQIVFPSTQNPSSNANTLDDYEEGTWLPVIGGDGGTSGQTYEIQSGHYVKIGQFVMVDFYVKFSAKGTITGDLQLQGLPFTAVAAINNGDVGSAALFWATLATTWVSIVARMTGSTTTATISGATAAAASSATALTTSDVGNTSTFGGTLCYRASA